MAASISDLLTQATTNSRPVPTTVTSTRSGGGTTLQCNALTGWPTGSAVHFCTYKVNTSGAKIAGSQLDMKGVVSGTTITSIVIEAGTDTGNAVGDIVEAAPTAAYANDLYSFGTQDHDTQGRHKQLTDTNGKTILGLSATASAVNYAQVANAATGNNVQLQAAGTDANVGITAVPKGTGNWGVKGRHDGWSDLSGFGTFTYNANNGQKEYVVTTPSDLSSFLTAGMKVRYDRGTTPPTQAMAFASASSQYATKASPSGITFTSAFTCEAWVYLNSYTGNDQHIIGRTDGSTGGFFLKVNSSGQVAIAYGASSVFTLLTTYQALPLSRWIHVAGVITSLASKTGQIYLNGVAVPMQAASGSATTLTQTSNLSVGAAGAGVGSSFLNGYVSEARVWSTNQSQANIQANMAISLTGSETNLVALFQGNGNFNDKTSNANNLTATNGAIATQSANPYNSTEYGIITKVTSTQLTIFTGTDYNIPNGTLSNPYYSTSRSPAGFPAGRDKWAVDFLWQVRQSITAANNTTWYNPGSFQLAVPAGSWNLGYQASGVAALGTTAGFAGFLAALSTSSSTAADLEMVASSPASQLSSTEQDGYVARSKHILLTTQTTYYYLMLAITVSGTTSLYAGRYASGGNETNVLRAECAYL